MPQNYFCSVCSGAAIRLIDLTMAQIFFLKKSQWKHPSTVWTRECNTKQFFCVQKGQVPTVRQFSWSASLIWHFRGIAQSILTMPIKPTWLCRMPFLGEAHMCMSVLPSNHGKSWRPGFYQAFLTHFLVDLWTLTKEMSATILNTLQKVHTVHSVCPLQRAPICSNVYWRHPFLPIQTSPSNAKCGNDFRN